MDLVNDSTNTDNICLVTYITSINLAKLLFILIVIKRGKD